MFVEFIILPDVDDVDDDEEDDDMDDGTNLVEAVSRSIELCAEADVLVLDEMKLFIWTC